MAKRTKPRYLLIDRRRYFYQRKVPLHLHDVLGLKKWHAPLGSDFDRACERLQLLRAEHDQLIERLEDPDELRDAKTAVRRQKETQQIEREIAEDEAYAVCESRNDGR